MLQSRLSAHLPLQWGLSLKWVDRGRDLTLSSCIAFPHVHLRLLRVFQVAGGDQQRKEVPGTFGKCWAMQHSVAVGCLQGRRGGAVISMDSRGCCVWYATKHFTDRSPLSPKPYKVCSVNRFSEEESEAQKGSLSWAMALAGDTPWTQAQLSLTLSSGCYWANMKPQYPVFIEHMGLSRIPSVTIPVWGSNAAGAISVILKLYSLNQGTFILAFSQSSLVPCLAVGRYSKQLLLTSFHHPSHNRFTLEPFDRCLNWKQSQVTWHDRAHDWHLSFVQFPHRPSVPFIGLAYMYTPHQEVYQ